MDLVGSLQVNARIERGRIVALDVQLVRPALQPLLHGRSGEAVAALLPRLYSVCARAQEAASRAAVAAACGRAAASPDCGGLWEERLHENLWRLFLDWPPALGLAPAAAALGNWRKSRGTPEIVAATRRVLGECLLGVTDESWTGVPAPGSLAACCLARLPSDSDAKFDLPVLTPEHWLPYWREGGGAPLASAVPRSPAGAYRARLDDAVVACRGLAAGESYAVTGAGGAGWGIGQIRTARGLLTHGVRLEGERVADYRIWAPTDRCFADAAPLRALVGELSWTDIAAARQAMECAILALDPCLPYALKLDHA